MSAMLANDAPVKQNTIITFTPLLGWDMLGYFICFSVLLVFSSFNICNGLWCSLCDDKIRTILKFSMFTFRAQLFSRCLNRTFPWSKKIQMSSSELTYQSLNWPLPLRKCPIKAPFKCKTSVHIFKEFYLEWSQWLSPYSYVMVHNKILREV